MAELAGYLIGKKGVWRRLAGVLRVFHLSGGLSHVDSGQEADKILSRAADAKLTFSPLRMPILPAKARI